MQAVLKKVQKYAKDFKIDQDLDALTFGVKMELVISLKINMNVLKIYNYQQELKYMAYLNIPNQY